MGNHNNVNDPVAHGHKPVNFLASPNPRASIYQNPGVFGYHQMRVALANRQKMNSQILDEKLRGNIPENANVYNR
jgi:hypothetical protein